MGSSIKDECLTKLYNILVSKYGKVTITRGLDHSYLGMRFQIYHHDRNVNISMSDFISDTMVNLETHTKVRMIKSTSDCDFSVFRYQYIVEFCQALIFDR